MMIYQTAALAIELYDENPLAMYPSLYGLLPWLRGPSADEPSLYLVHMSTPESTEPTSDSVIET